MDQHEEDRVENIEDSLLSDANYNVNAVAGTFEYIDSDTDIYQARETGEHGLVDLVDDDEHHTKGFFSQLGEVLTHKELFVPFSIGLMLQVSTCCQSCCTCYTCYNCCNCCNCYNC